MRSKNLARSVAIALAAAAAVLVPSPALAWDFVGTPTIDGVYLQLTHEEVVQVYNDPAAADRLCNSQILPTLRDLYGLNFFNSPLTIFNCAGGIRDCANAAVALGGYTVSLYAPNHRHIYCIHTRRP